MKLKSYQPRLRRFKAALWDGSPRSKDDLRDLARHVGATVRFVPGDGRELAVFEGGGRRWAARPGHWLAEDEAVGLREVPVAMFEAEIEPAHRLGGEHAEAQRILNAGYRGLVEAMPEGGNVSRETLVPEISEPLACGSRARPHIAAPGMAECARCGALLGVDRG